jgi:hypothetical protein
MAEKKVIEIDVQNNLGSLKSQLKQAQQEVQVLSDKFGATSQAAADAAKKAADLKDRIQDAKALTDAFNPDAKFTSLTRSLGGALDGFQAFEGALGLIGVESEDLQKTLLKVQSAMAFSQGIQGALEAKDSFIQLGSVVKNTFGAMTTASKAFLVGGIGLIIAAVGLIVANYDEWFGASKKVAEQQKQLAIQAKEQRENIAKESGSFATLIARLKNTNAGTKEREDLIKKINGQYGTTLKNIKDEAKFQESLNKELASYLEYQKAKYTLQKNEEFIVKNLEKQDELRAKIAKAEKDRNKAIQDGAGKQKRTLEEGITTYVNLNEEADKSLKKANETISKSKKELEAAEKRFNAYGSAANTAANNVDKITNGGTKYVEQNDKVVASTKEKTETEEEYVLTQQDLMDKINAIKQANYLNNLSENDKEIALVNDKYAELENSAQGNAEYLADIELAKMNEINDINLKYQGLDYKQKEEWRLKEEEAAKKAADKKIEIEKTLADTKKQIRDADFANAQAGINLISSLFEGNKKVQAAALIAQNAVAIAKTIIETKAANQAARASGTALSIATAGASVAAAEALILRNNIGAGISIAGIVAATGKGLSALKAGGSPSGGGNLNEGGGGGSGAGSVISANFNVVGNSGINQLGQLQQKPMKAYVVSGDVTTAQALDRNRIENATLVQ